MSLNKVNYVHGQTIISAQNMNDIQDEIIRLGEKEAVQSDWLEQDENSLAYVKNKPFGPAGQYQVLCIAEEAAISDKLIEITASTGYSQETNTYYLYNVTPNIWDIFRIGLYQKIAFEGSNGWYLTVYDMEAGGGTVKSLSDYDIPEVTGKVYFTSDTTPPLNQGIIIIEESTNPEIETGIYICFNAQKETWVKRVLFNRSYLWLTAPGALSTIDMPLGVNHALSVLKGISPMTPLKPMIDSVTESLDNFSSALDNKVDKVGNKVLSDVNFTKDYEYQVQKITDLQNSIYQLEYYHNPDYMDQEVLKQSAIMIANEIAANPYGVYLNTQELLGEYAKFMSGQTSDKIFMVAPGSEVFLTKISDKTPTKEDFKKGFSTVMAYPDVISGFMALRPQIGLMIHDIAFDPDTWENIGGDSAFTDLDEIGSFIFSDGFLILQEGNSMSLPKGLYVPTSFDMLILGLQINGFNLNASSAPVSQEQLGDISSILDSIIGEQVWTFTLEDGSTVDKVVISSD